MATTVLLVDDDPIVLESLPVFFSLSKSFQIIQRVSSAEDALDWLEQHDCDVVLSDIHLPGLSGIDLLKRLNRKPNPPKFVGITALDDDETMLSILQKGGCGYICKSLSAKQFISEMEKLLKGEIALSSSCVTRLVNTAVKQNQTPEAALSPLEKEILLMIKRGYTNARIAHQLNYAEITVKKKVSKMLEKFNMTSRAELAASLNP